MELVQVSRQRNIIRVLLVCSGNAGYISPYVLDQAKALAKNNIELEIFPIKGKGLIGYLKNRKLLKEKISNFLPDLVHSHYGLSGFVANLQREIPVVTTYHGSDINLRLPYMFSSISLFLSRYNIFASAKLADTAKVKRKFSVLSCGVDLSNFKTMDRSEARKKMHLCETKKYILFSSTFSKKIKNYPLAEQAIALLKSRGIDVGLIEFSGYSREECNYLLNAVDCVIITSFNESGPLVLKEAMAVNTCAVSVDVGDVRDIMKNAEGYYISGYDPEEFASSIEKALNFKGRTEGYKYIKDLDNDILISKLITIYKNILN